MGLVCFSETAFAAADWETRAAGRPPAVRSPGAGAGQPLLVVLAEEHLTLWGPGLAGQGPQTFEGLSLAARTRLSDRP